MARYKYFCCFIAVNKLSSLTIRYDEWHRIVFLGSHGGGDVSWDSVMNVHVLYVGKVLKPHYGVDN